MNLLLDSNVLKEVERDKVLSDNLEDLKTTLKGPSIELDNRTLSIADLKSFADSYDFIITENRYWRFTDIQIRGRAYQRFETVSPQEKKVKNCYAKSYPHWL